MEYTQEYPHPSIWAHQIGKHHFRYITSNNNEGNIGDNTLSKHFRPNAIQDSKILQKKKKKSLLEVQWQEFNINI